MPQLARQDVCWCLSSACAAGALLFSLYIIMDTHMIIEKFTCAPLLPALSAVLV